MGYLANALGDANNLGFFATPTDLTNAYPVGAPGYFAVVGSTDTIWVWDSGSNAWVDSGAPGSSAFVYIAYASDASGTNFTNTFNPTLDYIAVKSTTVAIPSPVAGDFTGLWKNYKGAMTWKGAYAGGTSYLVNDAVSYLGSSYICILASTGNLPTNGTYWNLVAQKGADGAGSGDVNGPATNTDNYIPQWNGANSKTLKDGINPATLWTDSSTNTGTNKTLNSNTNYIDADAMHSKVYLNLGRAGVIGDAVYVSAWNVANSCPEVSLARANGATTLPCAGVLESAGSDGTVQSMRIEGILSNVNTNSWSAGTLLYVSATTAGVLTSTRPTTPNFDQAVATVIFQNATTGILDVIRTAYVGTMAYADTASYIPATGGAFTGNISTPNLIEGFRTQATAGGTTTLVVGDAYQQIFTGSAVQTVLLPTTGIVAGQAYQIVNNSTLAVTVQSSGANTIVILATGTFGIFTALVATPTTAANWNYWYEGVSVASGKKATINNTMTFSGTDSSTYTFPGATKTLAANDGSNLTLASQAIGDLAVASSTTAYSRLADVAVGQVLISKGVGAAPAYSANPPVTNLIEGFRTQATAGGTTTLVVGDAYQQYFTGSSAQTCILPTTSIVAGQSYQIVNQSTLAVTVQSSGANTIVILAGGTSATFTALVATPTTAANWAFIYSSVNAASGKVATINNNITFTGTDTTTMTFPTTSKTIAANDGSNLTIASQAIGDILYASSTTAYTRLAAVAAGSVLVSAGTGTAPAYSANPQVTTIELGAATDTTLSRVSAGVIAVEGVTIPTLTSTSTLTNKRINPRLVTAASYTTDTGTSLDVSTCDQFEITAQAGALLFNSPSGTPLGGQKLIIRIKDNGTARALTYNAIFRAMGNALPATTVLSKTLYMGFIYNATDSKWDLVAVAQEA